MKLGELFEECEKEHLQKKIDRNDYLYCFYCIDKGLISLNDHRILDTLLSTPFYLHTFGALEWDPDALVEEGDELETV